MARKKMSGSEWRQGWCVGSITLSEEMAYWKNYCVWQIFSGLDSSTGLPRLLRNL